MVRILLAGLLGFLCASGCLMPPSRAQKLNDAARDLNVAARFGRVDLAAQRADESARETFLKRRALWGRGIRVMDAELGGIQMQGDDRATVIVDVAWLRDGEGVLRTTRLAQSWADSRNGWLLEREKRVAGDLGLFGEATAPQPNASKRDVHFATRVIGDPQ